MPAEWETHQFSAVAWPVKETMCFPENYPAVCAGYREIINVIADFEPVVVLINEPDDRSVPGSFQNKNISYLNIEHNDSWLRDNGPTVVIDDQGNRAAVSWKFNAWGEKYKDWDLDDMVARRLSESMGLPVVDAPFVLEGGSIHVDGQGTLLTTEECLLNPMRNPHLTKTDLEKHFKELLQVSKCIWLKQGLYGDETDGHIDNIACFASPGTVLIQDCTDPDDPNYARTIENIKILEHATDAAGRRLNIVKLPQPPAIEEFGKRLTLSYINFYFVNGGLILPVFKGGATQADQQAEEVFRRLFPKRVLRKIDGMAIVREGGNVHCATQQIPAAKKI